MAKEFRRSKMASWEENCSNLAPITSRELTLSWRAADTESSLPMAGVDPGERVTGVAPPLPQWV